MHEPDTLGAILHHLGPSGVFVDVEANVGALSPPVAACRPDAQIICIEADPQIISLLKRNVAENGRANISIVHCLAGPIDDARVSFYRAPAAKFGMGSIGPQFGASPVKLTQRPLDDVLDELAIGEVDVIKLDIEGAEFGALQGLSRRLASVPAPTIVFEFVDWAETRVEGQVAGGHNNFCCRSVTGCSGWRAAADQANGSSAPTGYAMILALPSSACAGTKD